MLPPPFQGHVNFRSSTLQRQSSSELASEMAAQLLLLSIRWVKSIPSMASLQIADQLSLVAESWRELFVLAASQYQLLRTIDDGSSERKEQNCWKRRKKNKRSCDEEEHLEVVDDDVTSCVDKEPFNGW